VNVFSDTESDIVFIHQQGSGSSFKNIYEALKNDLVLDDKKQVSQPQTQPTQA